MKNITALTVLVIIVCVFSSKIYASGQEKKYAFSFGPQFGFVYGQAQELVYPINTKGELLSELLWDMKPVFYLGAKADFDLRYTTRIGFFASLNFKAGIPADSGIIENRDWMSVENSALTHFSSHENNTNEFFQLDIDTGHSFSIKSYFYIKPFINFSWMRFSFRGKYGYGKYARPKGNGCFFPIDENPIIKNDFSEDVIRYEQNWLLLSQGVSVGTDYLSPFAFNLSFKISPLTYCASVDEHIERRTTFMDFTGFGLFIEPAFNVSFIVKRFELSLDFAYRYIGRTRGKTFIQQGNGDIFPSEGEVGAALSFISTGFLFKIRL